MHEGHSPFGQPFPLWSCWNLFQGLFSVPAFGVSALLTPFGLSPRSLASAEPDVIDEELVIGPADAPLTTAAALGKEEVEGPFRCHKPELDDILMEVGAGSRSITVDSPPRL